MRALPLPLLITALVLGGCGDPTGPATELARNRERWHDQALADYEFLFRRACYCLPEALGPVQIRVAAGAVAAVIDTLGQPIDSTDAAHFFTITIDSLFGVVEHAIAVGAHRLSVQYHRQLGYPESIVIDYDAVMVDEEMSLSAALLEPLSAPPRAPDR
jgi:hypothetical protein